MEFPEIKAYSVTELNREIKYLLEAELGSVWIEGEISNLRKPFSGHSYFTLKDEGAQIRSVLFKGQKALIRFDPEDGQRVLVKGRLTVYEPRGDYQVIVDYMEPKGFGALQKAFEQLKEKLSGEGLFNEEHKKDLPFLPSKIGIITSSTGAAIRDILQILGRRFPNIQVLIAPVKVQGQGAAEEIASAIQDLNEHGQADVIIVGRGGGSLEDLWAFNEEIVARAIFKSGIPVISAVGHEIDFTIADFVSDLRAPTPSAAAELVVPNKDDLLNSIASFRNQLTRAVKNKIAFQRERLDNLRERPVFKEPAIIYNAARQRLDYLVMGLERNMASMARDKKYRLKNIERSLELLSPAAKIHNSRKSVEALYKALEEKVNLLVLGSRGKLEGQASRLQALSPLAVLARGFSVCRDKENKVVRDSGQVNPGDNVNLLLSKGELRLMVEESK